MQSNKNVFQSFSEAYLKIIKDIIEKGTWVEGVKDPNSIGSDFGNKIIRTKEILTYTFCIQHPQKRYLSVSNRNINTAYALANFLWLLLGNKKGKQIIAFNKNGSVFMNQKGELNSAIGPHIFKLRNGIYLQLSQMESLLKTDPSTRRAVIQVFKQEDLNANNRDVSCCNHMQFFLRRGKLHSHVVMRSQSALMVLPYDYFVFSLFHEALSVRLNVQLGKLYYTSNSLHIYEDEVKLAKRIEANEVKFENLKMKNFDNETIKKLAKIFLALSKVYENNDKCNIDNLINNTDLDIYWQKMLKRHFKV